MRAVLELKEMRSMFDLRREEKLAEAAVKERNAGLRIWSVSRDPYKKLSHGIIR